MPSPIFYATVVPLIVYIIVKKGIVEPFLKEEKTKKLEKQKQNNFNKLLEKRFDDLVLCDCRYDSGCRKEAMAAQDLMQATYSRNKEEEERKRGLVIIKAIYGKILKDSGDTETSNDVIDVTVPVQCLVKDSKLVIHENSKVSS